MSADLATLKARIADEINRTDLTSQISNAITSAIAKYRSWRFEVNEQTATFSTAASTESYAAPTLPSDIGEIDSIRMTFNGRRMVLKPMNFLQMQALATSTSTNGQPSYWSWYAQTLYFYPIPDAIYSTLIAYQQRKAAPASDSDTSTIWTNQAEALVRHCAKKLLYRDVVKDANNAQAAEIAEREALTVLENESIQLQDDGDGMTAQW